jgi:hypothetical protein
MGGFLDPILKMVCFKYLLTYKRPLHLYLTLSLPVCLLNSGGLMLEFAIESCAGFSISEVQPGMLFYPWNSLQITAAFFMLLCFAQVW